jgi:hypothetical protein
MKRIALILFVLALGGLGPDASGDVDVVITDYMGLQVVGKETPLGKEKTNAVSLFAARGEYECFSFWLQPKERIADVMIKGGPLKGPAGVIPAENVVPRSAEGGHGDNKNLLILGNKWDMAGWSREEFWVTVRVPDDAKPGVYKGQVTVVSEDKPVAAVDVTLEVLPFALEEPPFMIGWHYAWPKGDGRTPDMADANLELLRVTLKDMREHGCTNVGPLYGFHLPVTDDDTGQINRFITEYLKAGYTKPLMFAAAMNLSVSELTGYGPVDSKRFQQKYIEVMRKLHAEMKKHPIPVIFSIGDEFTNKGLRGVEYAGKLAKLTYEELPEIVTTSDMNGYMEVMAMAPWMNFATFNNGWDGSDHHNKGRQLLNEQFIKELTSKTDAIPYFVNTGKGRFPFGFYFWKMTKYGVRGKVEWFYNLESTGGTQGSMVTLSGAEAIPTVYYEQSREGIDDLKYVCMLEKLVADAKKSGKAKAQAQQAETFLKKLEDSIIPNWTAYSQGGMKWPVDGMEEVDPNKAAAIGSLNTIRRGIADHIIKLQDAMK